MDEPIPHKNFTLLGQGSYEIPPSVSDVVPKPLVFMGLTFKIFGLVRNHAGKKFRKIGQTSFTGIVH